MKILKFLIALWLGTAMIAFVVMPPLGIYILFLPTMPFTELSTYFSTKSRNKEALDFRLKHSSILTKKEGIMVAKRICNLEHLDKYKTNEIFLRKAKKFCTLNENDKVYFYKDCAGCNASNRDLTTGYVLVRDGDPIESIFIESNKTIRIIKDNNSSNYFDKHIPIIKQLH